MVKRGWKPLDHDNGLRSIATRIALFKDKLCAAAIPNTRRISDSNHGLLRQDGFQDAQIVTTENEGDFLFLVAVFLQAVD